MSPLRTAILAQAFGGLIAAGLMALVFRGLPPPLVWASIQGVCAALVSHRLEAPPWWLPIHLVFMPLAISLNGLNLPSFIYLVVFAVLLLVFWRTDRSQVPLYLSNAATAEAVVALLPAASCNIIDLGCGNGRLLKRLAQLRPDCRFVGTEHAPLPWLWAKLINLDQRNCQIKLGDFWHQDLGAFDIVYAFLSPAPMSRLWIKARKEMRLGALLISNSFPVSEVAAELTIQVADRRATRLYCYRPLAEKAANPPYSHAIAANGLHQ